MAEANPELRERLEELDRELEVRKMSPIVAQRLIFLSMQPTFGASIRHWSRLERDWLVSHAIECHPRDIQLLTLCLP
jgi:hypothetical protein